MLDILNQTLTLDSEAIRLARRVVRESAGTDSDDPFVIISKELVRVADVLQVKRPVVSLRTEKKSCGL